MLGANVSAANTVEQRKIRAVAMAYERAWNRHDMAALAQLFTEDADWINICGHALARQGGRHQSTRSLPPDDFPEHGNLEISISDVAIRMITADVAALVIALQAGAFVAPDGTQRPATLDRLSLILAKRDGNWAISHGHNTVVDTAAQRFDPVNRD